MRQRGSSNGPSTTSFLRQTSNANVFFLRAFSNHIELRAECRNLSELPGGQPTPGAGPKSYSEREREREISANARQDVEALDPDGHCSA
jgi:hypothetical protein